MPITAAEMAVMTMLAHRITRNITLTLPGLPGLTIYIVRSRRQRRGQLGMKTCPV